MSELGIWRITPEGPQRLAPGNVDFEGYLEDWIAQDPSLIESGLTIVGRQVRTEAGPLDLLALDPQGTWVVIELKREPSEEQAVSRRVYALPAVLLEAESHGVGAPFRAIIDAAQRNGLYVRPWFGPDLIARFFPELTREGIERVLGPGGSRWLTPEEALAFASNLNQVFNLSRATSQPRGADSRARD